MLDVPRGRAGSGRWRQAMATGWREYLATNPLRIIAMTMVPRAVLQSVFLILLGELIGGPDARRHAFIGAVALTLTLSTTVGIADVPSSDKWSGTFWRIRIGWLSPFAVFLLRSTPYPVVGLGTAVVTSLITAPLVGMAWAIPQMLALFPWLALLAVTTSTAGMAGAALAVGRRADVLVGNLVVLLPPGQNSWVDVLGSVLPMRHGLVAFSRLQAGRPFAAELGLEVVVGACWFGAAWILVQVQAHRARSKGHDNFT
jgi:hypothetical protein